MSYPHIETEPCDTPKHRQVEQQQFLFDNTTGRITVKPAPHTGVAGAGTAGTAATGATAGTGTKAVAAEAAIAAVGAVEGAVEGAVGAVGVAADALCVSIGADTDAGSNTPAVEVQPCGGDRLDATQKWVVLSSGQIASAASGGKTCMDQVCVDSERWRVKGGKRDVE